jgi:hypothetical protein
MSWRRADGPLWWQQAYHLNGAAASSGGTFEHIERIAQTGGVQLRHPLLSRRVLEFILQMPPELTLHPLLMRPHLRGAVSHRLPAAITLRPSKSFFNDVRDDFLRRHDLDLSRTLLLGADAETAQYVNRDLVVSLLSDASPDDLWGGTLRVLAGTELFLRQQRSPEVLTALLDQLPTATVTFARSGSRSHRPDQTPPFLPPMDDR